VKASALALVLLAAPGCSAQADDPARSEEHGRLAALIPDRPDGPVLDQADILPPDEEADLNRRLTDYWNRTHTAVVVVSVNSLGGEPIERFSLRLARDWDIGDAANLRGLLVLVAPTERKVRIEVSCGLENVISDAFAGRVIRERMTPKFKNGALDAGTLAAVDALIGQMDASGNPAPLSDSCRSHMRQAA
jgi:uncharacterized protein